MNQIDFLLVPDRYAARYLRRRLTDRGDYLSTVVGTFNELIECARGAYLLPKADEQWSQKLINYAIELPDTFWSKSIVHYQRESTSALELTLTKLLEGFSQKNFQILLPWKTCLVLARSISKTLYVYMKQWGKHYPRL